MFRELKKAYKNKPPSLQKIKKKTSKNQLNEHKLKGSSRTNASSRAGCVAGLGVCEGGGGTGCSSRVHCDLCLLLLLLLLLLRNFPFLLCYFSHFFFMKSQPFAEKAVRKTDFHCLCLADYRLKIF